MDIKKRVDNNIPFSLHDSRIIKISAEAERLTLTFDKVYEYNGDNEKSYPATMLFEGIDYEECDVIVFDSALGYGSFTGTRYRMREFVDKFPNGIFEIITETYSGYDTVFRGYIYKNGCVYGSGIISIWTMGDVILSTNYASNKKDDRI
jgi:hypothetical protein